MCTSRALRPGRARRPPGPRQRVPRHHGAVAVEQRRGEAGLDRRQRHPPIAEAQHAVVVERGRRVDPGLDPALEPLHPGPQVDVAGRHADPVLEVVGTGRPAGPRRPRAGAGAGGPRAAARRAAPPRRASARGRHPRRRPYGGNVSRLFRPCEAFSVPSSARSQARRRVCTYAAPPWLASRTSTTSHRSPCSRRARRRSCKRWRGRPTRSTSPPARPSASRARSAARPSSSSSGTAEVRRNKKKVATLGPGACVGELALLDHGPRTASVIAATDLTVLVIGAREFAGDPRRGPVDRPQADEVAGRARSGSSTPRPTADGSGPSGPEPLRSQREAQAPPAGHRGRRGVRHDHRSARGSPPPLAQWHDDSDVQREVFGNIPSVWKLVFYTVLPVLVLYGSVLFSQRVRNWERGAPDNRKTTAKNAGRRLKDFRAGVYMQTLLRDPAAGIMHSLIYFSFLILLAVTTVLGDQPPAARVGQVPPRRRLPGLLRRRRRRRPRCSSSAWCGRSSAATCSGPTASASRPSPSTPSSSARSSPSPSPASAPRCGASPCRAGPSSRSGRSSATRCPALIDGHEQPGRRPPGLVGRPRRHASSSSWRSCPVTMLRHIFTSPLNMYLRDRERPKGAMRPMPNLMETELESFGASTIEDFTWKQLLDTDACTMCGRCTSVCPAHATGKPLDPREIVLKTGEVMARTGTPAGVAADRRRPRDHRRRPTASSSASPPRRCGPARRARRATRSAR